MDNLPVFDLSEPIVLTSIFQRANPDVFHQRLCSWLTATGFDYEQMATTYQLLTMLDDERLLSLGRLLTEELTRGGPYA